MSDISYKTSLWMCCECLKPSRQPNSVQCEGCLACAHCTCAGFRTYAEASASNILFFCKTCNGVRQNNIPRPSPIPPSKQQSTSPGLASSPLSPLANSPPKQATRASPVDSPFSTPLTSPDSQTFSSQASIPIQSRQPPPPPINLPPFNLPPSPNPASPTTPPTPTSQDHAYAIPPLMSIEIPPSSSSTLESPHPDLPNLDIVLATHITTLNHIPKASRDSCCYALSVLHNNIVSNPSIYNWSLLLLFSKLVLANPVRGGKNSRNVSSIVNDRLKRWSEGHFSTLWSDSQANQGKLSRRQRQSKSQSNSQSAFNAKKAESKASSGQYRNALQALSSEGLADDTREVLQALRDKHPQGCPAALPEGPCPEPITIPPDSVKSAATSFNADTAPGPSGFRANFFKDLFSSPNPNQRQRFFSSLTSLVNVMNKGKIPSEIRPYLFAATLHAAKKKQGGIRPIAIGDVYSRLTSKCLASLLADEASSLLRPFQLGFKVRGGCESVIHATSATFHSDSPLEERYILQVDLENAYNNVDRSHFLAETRKRLPSLSSWAEVSYGSSSHLFFRGHRLTSSVGTKQGCPLGGLLFNLGLQPILDAINSHVPNLVANQWIMDDGTIVGCLKDLASVIDLISSLGPEKGFLLNPAKSSIWVGGHFADNSDPTGRNIPKADPRGIQLLGSPIGSDVFMQEIVSQRISTIEETVISKLSQINNPQIQLCLLRSCLSLPKISYTQRTCNPSALSAIYDRFDDIQFTALEEILSCPLSSLSWRQATLPVSMGGLGLRSAPAHAAAAFLSSRVQTKSTVDEILMSFPHLNDFDFALSLFRTSAGCLPPEVSANLATDSGDFSQKNLSYLIDSNLQSTLIKEVQSSGDKRASARLLSVSLPQAGAFLNAVPNPIFGLSIIPEYFRVAVQYRLGLPVYTAPHPCPACGKDSDINGDHTITCSSEYERIHRHDTIRDAIFESAKHAGLSPVKEARLVSGSLSRPGDIYLPIWRGRQTAFDIAVTSPLSQSALPQSHKTPGAAISSMKSSKMNKHFRPCQVNGVHFIPLVVETLGGCDSDAMFHLRAIAKQSTARSPSSTDIASRQLFQRLSVLLQRANAGLIVSRAPPLPPPHIIGV